MKRFRPLRISQIVRDQHADVPSIGPESFIYPYFVMDGCGVKEEISTMEGVFRFSIDTLLTDIAELLSFGINKVLLFGVIPQEEKDERGSAAYKSDNIISRAVRRAGM